MLALIKCFTFIILCLYDNLFISRLIGVSFSKIVMVHTFHSAFFNNATKCIKNV